MAIRIQPMTTEAEMDGKGYVHWKSWQETYAGLVDSAYLEAMTLDKCVRIAHQWPERILVAKDDDMVVGFAAYGAYRDQTMQETGEVYALYVLRAYQGRGIGRALMEASLDKLAAYPRVALWVLKRNERAIRFYRACGFAPDGLEQPITLGTENTEVRMVRLQPSI